MNPKLSICIATLNRAGFIGQTLSSIIEQATEDVEIVVVDGASIDNTEEVVHSFQQRFPRLKYVRLPQKGGVDQDYDRSVLEATGKVCWLFSDDDLLKPNAISSVLTRIDEGYGLIIVNAEARSADLSELQQQYVCPIEQDRVYESNELEQLLQDTAKYLTFIGCVVMDRQLWLSRERPTYYGSAFIHVGVIFQAPLPVKTLFLAEPLITIRYGNASWTGRAFDIWMVQWPGLIWSFAHLSDASKRSITRKEPWRDPTVLFLTRAVDGFSLDIYRKKYRLHLRSRMDKIIAIAIAMIPGVIVNFIAILAFRFFRPQDELMQINFRNAQFYYKRYFKLFGNHNRV